MKRKEIIEFIEKLNVRETERNDRTIKTFVFSRPLNVQVEVRFGIQNPPRIIDFQIKKINILYFDNQLLIHFISKNYTTISLRKLEAIYLLKHKKLTKDDKVI